MDSDWYWVAGGLVVGLLFAALLLVPDYIGASSSEVAVPTGFATVSSGSTADGDVSIDLRPIGIVDGFFVFDLSANTHSVTLADYDLFEASTLVYAGGEVKPVRALRLTGHHSGGELAFALSEVPDSFEVRISGVPAVDERVFRWGDAE